MAYEKQIWETGEIITADKLNHMEDGIAEGGSGGGNFVVNFTHDEQTDKYTADKTIQEIRTAAISSPVIGHMYFGDFPGPTYVLNVSDLLAFTGAYVVSGNTGVISVLEPELDEVTDEPTGLWTLTSYIINVTNPE